MELRVIDRTDRAKSRLHAALDIYRKTILPEAQNPEAQILYWIDHSNDALADEFRCFALQSSGKVTGYLQYSYFREEHVFFFEYLCIQDSSRSGLVPTHAIEDIEDYLAQNYRPDFTIAFEVAQKKTRDQQWKSDQALIKYFTRLGFRTVEFKYRYPILQSYDGATSYPADLMVMLPQQRTTVTASEMRTILRCIYFKHYLRWDRPFLAPGAFAQRERLINDLYSEQAATIRDDDIFGTKGDDRRAARQRFLNNLPSVGDVVNRFFSPKMPRLLVVMSTLVGLAWFLKRMGDLWMFFPVVLAASLLYCLGENTKETRKLFVVILARMRSGKQRSS